MVLVQKRPFFQLFSLMQYRPYKQYRPGKCLLRYSKTKTSLSRLEKQEVQKREKLTFFQKGLSQGFGPKWPFFQLFFRQYRPVKCLLRYSSAKKRLSRV